MHPTLYMKVVALTAHRMGRPINPVHVAKLVESYREWKDIPLLVTRGGEVFDGVHRLEALKTLYVEHSPVIIVEDYDPPIEHRPTRTL